MRTLAAFAVALSALFGSSRAEDTKAAGAKASGAKSEDPADKAAGKKDAAKPRSLFDGKSLGEWKDSGFATQGRVEVKDGTIVVGFGEGCSGVTFKGKFPETNYELRLEAMRVDGSDFFCGLTFPVARKDKDGKKAETQPCTLILGGWGGQLVGLSSINGSDASENSHSTSKEFANGKWYKVRLRVTEPKIEAWLDDEKIIDLTMGDQKLSIRLEVEESKPLGIATWRTTGAYKNIEVLEVKEPHSPPDKDEEE
jgi:hypothetical protein